MFKSAVEVLWTARYDYQPDWKLLKHEHEYFQMICFLSGSGQLTLGEREYGICPGGLFLIKPHCYHGLNPASAVKTLDVKFLVKDRGLRDLLLNAGDKVEENDCLVANLFERIRLEGEHAAFLYREMCAVYLTHILIQFLRQNESVPSETAEEPDDEFIPDPLTQNAIDFVKRHYAEDLNLQRLAQAVGKSDRYIRRRFEEFLGTSPTRYLLRYRIRKSKELIRQSDYPLKEVAELVGFKTIHHFARTFHDICGETPGAWRRKYRAGICKDVCIHPQFSNPIWTVPREILTRRACSR